MAGSDDIQNPKGNDSPQKGSGNASAGDAVRGSASDAAGSDLLDASEIEALLKQGGAGAAPTAGKRSPSLSHAASNAERLIDQAEADLAAAVASELDPRTAALSRAKAFEFPEFGAPADDESPAIGLQALQDVELNLHVELGRAELLIQEVLSLKEGSVVPLDKLAGDPVDILVNGRLVARGEVLVLNDNFCVRVAEILTPEM